MPPKKYALLMHVDPDASAAMSRAELDQVLAKHTRLHEDFLHPGELLNGAGLNDPRETTIVRLEDGEVARTTGPLNPGKLSVSSYYVVECESRDRAIEIAEYILDSHVEAVEVRAIHDTANM